MDKFIESVRASFPAEGPGIVLGAPVLGGAGHPEPLARVPLAMMNRHGLIAGATGTGKTRTLQLMAEQLSAQGIPVFLTDVKGDLSGLGAPGEPSDRVTARARETGYAWTARGCPVQFLSLTGTNGAQARATLSTFGPLLLGKILDLSQAQSSALSLVFKWCDDRKLPLLDLPDLRAVLTWLTGEGAADLKEYGAVSKQTAGVLLRKMVELEQQGAERFFGEPELEIDDLLEVEPDGRGRISILSLQDVQAQPIVFSTFVTGLLARLYSELPEVGDVERPKLVFFFDEAHLVFRDASKEFLASIEQVVRLIRSKGVGIFFITQSPKDIPAPVLGQLGNRVQHALRAFTEDDEKALRAAARTFPKTSFYDIEETLTTMGIGEAFTTVLTDKGTPTPPIVVRVVPPASRMGPLDPGDMAAAIARSELTRRYGEPIDRESAREMLTERMAPKVEEASRSARAPAPGPRAEQAGTLEEILRSPVARTVTREVTRGLLGALLGGSSRRRRGRGFF